MSGVKKSSLPPFPNGWFVVCLSENLKPGQLVAETFCGEDVVVYRTAQGKPVVMEAYCPHLGAHFAHGGHVEGDQVVCPFHGFCFDPTGKCVKTGYGTKPPPQAKTKVWPVREQNGIILAFHHEHAGTPAGEPTWEVPPLVPEGWSEVRFQEWQLESNPQEIAENSVDIGHFSLVHGYTEVKTIIDLETEGPFLHAKYGMARVANFVGNSGGKKVHVEFDISQWGLGYAAVEAKVVEYDMISRHYVLATPIDGTNVHLRIGVSLRKDFQPKNIHPLLGIIPRSWLFPAIMNGYFNGYKNDVHDDFKIWKNKIYVHPPALAKGDGPVIQYRKWAQQFHPEAFKPKKRVRPSVQV